MGYDLKVMWYYYNIQRMRYLDNQGMLSIQWMLI